MDNDKKLRYVRKYLKIAVLTLVFFSATFGVEFFKSYIWPQAETDGLANDIFLLPFLLTIALILICIVLLYVSKRNVKKSNLPFVLASVLIIPVAVFGFFMFFAVLVGLVKLFGRLMLGAI